MLAFAVNETLLDLKALDPRLDDRFGTAALRPLAARQRVELSDKQVDETVALMSSCRRTRG